MEEDNADKAAEQEAGDGSKPRNGIRSRWEKYKKEFSGQQVRCVLSSVSFSALNASSLSAASAHVRASPKVPMVR